MKPQLKVRVDYANAKIAVLREGQQNSYFLDSDDTNKNML